MTVKELSDLLGLFACAAPSFPERTVRPAAAVPRRYQGEVLPSTKKSLKTLDFLER